MVKFLWLLWKAGARKNLKWRKAEGTRDRRSLFNRWHLEALVPLKYCLFLKMLCLTCILLHRDQSLKTAYVNTFHMMLSRTFLLVQMAAGKWGLFWQIRQWSMLGQFGLSFISQERSTNSCCPIMVLLVGVTCIFAIVHARVAADSIVIEQVPSCLLLQKLRCHSALDIRLFREARCLLKRL